MKRLTAAFALLRPGNLAVVGLSVLVGGGGFWSSDGLWRVLLAAASAMLVAGGGNALNDYFDLEADRINRPQRPLPSGQIKPVQALVVCLLSFLAGNVLGWLASPPNGSMALAVTFLLVIYAWRGKQLALLGNLMVATACAAAFIYGGLATGAFRLSLIPSAFAFLMHLAREIIKDVEDVEGDRAAGAWTVGLALGERRALRLAASLLALLVALTPLPFIFDVYGWRYLVAVVLGVDLLLLPIIFWLASGVSGEQLSKISFMIKIIMLAGIMSICLGLSK